ncbi:uncharacterized protein V6R79_022811 [Siganus canaliculatus]
MCSNWKFLLSTATREISSDALLEGNRATLEKTSVDFEQQMKRFAQKKQKQKKRIITTHLNRKEVKGESFC